MIRKIISICCAVMLSMCILPFSAVHAESSVPAAVLTSSGDLIFFNTTDKSSYSGQTKTVKDTLGNTWTGKVYMPLNDGREHPFISDSTAVKHIYTAKGQTVRMPSDMSQWFTYMTDLRSFDGRGMDTSGVTSMAGLFDDCYVLNTADLTSWDTSSVRNMEEMFQHCESLSELDLSGFDTSAAENMDYMFRIAGIHVLKLGTKFVHTPQNGELSLAGEWTNGTVTVTGRELMEQYPDHIEEWNGTWTRLDLRPGFVERMYQIVLDRKPDPDGRCFWETRLREGKLTAADLVKGFFLSREFTNRELCDEEFTEICYSALMDRNSDAGGKNSWLRKMENGMSRTYVLKGFVNSVEFAALCNAYGIDKGTLNTTEARDRNEGITAFAARCYREVLGRRYDAGGLNSWCSKILTSSNKKQEAVNTASNGFFHSPEFMKKNTGNEEYVNILYHTFLGREADEAGFRDWTGRLAKGASRDSVLIGFANSREFANIMAEYGIR